MGHEFLLAVEHLPRHLISPNMHVIMVHFPLGIFVFGLFLEVFGFLWSRSSARAAARWMILFGGLLAVPAALSGIDAYKDVAENSRHEVTTADGKEKVVGLSDDQWNFMRKHILLASIGAGLAAIGVTIAMGLSDLWRRRLYFPVLIILIAGAVLMTFGSHFGGEGIYLEGVGVQLRGTPSTGFEYYAPAESIHVLLAGLAIAVSLGALGSSMRILSTYHTVRDDVLAEQELQALTATAPATGPIVIDPIEPRRVTDDVTVARTLNERAVLPRPRIPSASFWLLSALLFLITLGFGVWLLESVELSRAPSEITATQVRQDIQGLTKGQIAQNRRIIHVVLGAALVLFPLILAIGIRWMAGARVIMAGLLFLMVLMIAAEIWLGILLIYKGSEGPLFKFASPPSAETRTMPVFTSI